MSTDVAAQVGRIVWHTLNSSDPEKAKRFYRELLGWPTEVMTVGGFEVEIISTDGVGHGDFQQAPEGVPSHWIAHVQVGSVDETLGRAKAAGATPLMEPMDMAEVGRFCPIRDPQGAVISLYTPQSWEGPIGEGIFVWDELISDDVEGSKRFYTEVVGWTAEGMDVGGFVYTLFKRHAEDRGSAGLLPKQEGMEFPNAWFVYLATEDVDASAERTKELGGAVYAPPFDVPNVGRLAMCADPTGAAFGLFKFTEG